MSSSKVVLDRLSAKKKNCSYINYTQANLFFIFNINRYLFCFAVHTKGPHISSVERKKTVADRWYIADNDCVFPDC